MSKLQVVFGVIVGALTFADLFDLVNFPGYIRYPFVSLFVAVWLFTGGIHAKQIYEKKQADSFLLWMYAPLVMVVILLDVLFNATWGSLIYRELPKEWLFTTRTKRHYYGQNSSQHQIDAAERWAYRLNAIDPGHV